MSKISDYKFENQVRQLRAEGKSNRRIADILNQQIPKEDEPISEMAIIRWLKADKATLPLLTTGDAVAEYTADRLNERGVQESEDVNPYDEAIKLINDCDFQIEALKKRIEKSPLLGNSRGNTDPQSLLVQYIARKQSLLADVASYQKDLASFVQVKETLKLVFDTLKSVSPESYEQFKKEIVEKQNIKNLVR